MNKVILMGRLTSNPELRYSNGQNHLAVCRYTLAVDRNGKEKGTDFSLFRLIQKDLCRHLGRLLTKSLLFESQITT